MFGRKYTMPTHARAFGQRDASHTPVAIVTISIEPSTQPRSVTWSWLYPNEATMSWRWFVSELGMLSSAEKSANSHVFGSHSASITCARLKRLFSTPV
jgi:hypothetical protein